MLDVRRMRLLHELSQRGTLAATARALNYTPSAVSQQLSALEREAGVVLLERDGRGVRLTEAAHGLVRRAERVLEELEAAETELQAHAGRVTGTVRVAAFPTAVRGLVAPAARRLRTAYPEVRLAIFEADPEDGMSLLHGGRVDASVAYEYDTLTPLRSGGMERLPLLADPMCAALPATHALAAADTVDVRDLRDEDWIAGLPGTPYGTLVDRICRQAGFEPRIAHRAREFAVQESLVAAGLGIAVLPSLGCRTGSAEVAFPTLRAPKAVRHVVALTRHGGTRRPPVRAALDQIMEMARAPRA